MKIADLKGKKITVMGLGLQGGGLGTVRFLHMAGALLTVTDMKSKEELTQSLEKLKDLKNVNYVFQQHRPEDFTAVDMVVKNPVIPWNNKQIKLALENKVPVEIDSSLFFKFCARPIVGVTGTKGKTTTSNLIYEILKVAGKNPIKVGIGQTPVLGKLGELKKDSTVVFELSSWRLSALGRNKLSPKIAVLTNIYPDHLNYYKSMDEYVRDKKMIFSNQKKDGVCVINHDNEILREMAKEIKSKTIIFSKQKITDAKSVYVDDGGIYFNDGIDEKKIMNTSEIGMRGEHNLENVLAAVAVAVSMGVDLSAIKKAVSQFQGVDHRLEFVRKFDGIDFFNDSAATTPEAAISGINSFSAPIILIAGGADKNLEMTEFGRIISQKIKGIVFLKGQATDKILTAMKKVDPSIDIEKFKVVESMEKAVELARLSAESGDVVLLSPGAASFGLFNNEFERGDKFRMAVKNLK
jgi:UDP-N-acetylmuramoylalanine--D-glutamate ligase